MREISSLAGAAAGADGVESAGSAAAAAEGIPSSDTTLTLQGAAALGPGANANLLALKAPLEPAAQATKVSVNVLAATAWQESRADPSAAGGGLLQIGGAEFSAMQLAHPQIVGVLSDAAANAIAGGRVYLLDRQAALQQRFGRSDWGIVLRAYNSGDFGVDPNNLRALPAGTGDANYVTLLERFIGVIQSSNGTLPP